MDILVFGGSGFLGSHACDSLSEAGHNVRIFDLVPSPYLRADQEMIIGNILDQDAVSTAIAGADAVYNFAGIADLDDAATKPMDTVQLNILGNLHIMEGCVEHKVARYVYASSIYVFSEKGGFYRCSKQAAELYIAEYQRRYDMEFTILRFGTLFGPRANHRNSVYRYLNMALKNRAITTEGNPEARREYIYVKDAAQLTLEALDKQYANQRIVLTGHQSIYFKDLLYMIQEIIGEDVTVEILENHAHPAHYSMTPYSYSPKAGKKLTLNPYTDMGQGLIECLGEMDSESGN